MKPQKILTTEPKLLSYAGWYVLRYMPSRAKLEQALMKKSDNTTVIVTQVMEQMEGHIREDRTIESLIRMWLDRGKTEVYMRTKFREKQFDPLVIEEILAEYSEWLSDWRIYEKVATQKIVSMLERGKSRRFIEMTLRGLYPLFTDQINILLDSLCLDEADIIRGTIQKYASQYDLGDPKSRQKIIQKLVARGFGYDLIKKWFSAED